MATESDGRPRRRRLEPSRKIPVEDFTSGFMVNLLIVLGELLVLVALTSLLMIVEPLATLGALVVIAVPTALVYRSMQHRLGASGRVAEESFALMLQWAEQAISSAKEITITGRRSFFINQHSYHVQRFTDSLVTLRTFHGCLLRHM